MPLFVVLGGAGSIMQKLDDLRAYLERYDTLIDPSKVLIFSDKGRLKFHRTPNTEQFKGFHDAQVLSPDYSYTQTVTVNLIVTDFVGELKLFDFVLLFWLNQNVPDLAPDAVTFEIDHLDKKRLDLHYKFEIKNHFKVTPQDGGGFTVDGMPIADAFGGGDG